MKMQPLRDNIIVRIPELTETVRESGIVLLEKTKESNTIIANVIAVGEGRRDSVELTPLTVKVGDRVVIGDGTGVKLDKTTLMVREEDIFAIVRD